jgi:beta-N-acetylhexosaminidase
MSQATAAVASMSVQDQAGNVIMASSANAVGTDLVARLHLGGVILMGSKGAIDGTDGGNPEQVAAVTGELQSQVPAAQTGAALLVATDQESGLVTRLVNGFTDFPGAQELSSISDTATAAAATESVTRAAGSEMLAVGINVDFAPDADVLPESGESGVEGRTFGSDPERNGTLVAAAVRGYQSAGIAATVKHFPGIGRLATDTHKALPTLDIGCDEWNSVEAVPMRAGVDAGAALVMTGHVLMPAVGDTDQSSALTSAVVTDLLRGAGNAGCNGLNFHGVSVSDSFQMAPVVQNFSPGEAAWRGLAAGQDLVLMPQDPEAAVNGIAAAVADGSLPANRLQEAATRVYALRLALARSPKPGLDIVASADHENIAAQARNAG